MSAEYPIPHDEFVAITDDLAHAQTFHGDGYVMVAFGMQGTLVTISMGMLNDPAKLAADAVREAHAAALKLCDCPDQEKKS